MGGKPFKLYKFRTMGLAHDRGGHRIPDGDRLNAIGRFLRDTRLDELPQLWNILVGEMSFVGPRPLLHVDQPATHAARLLARPGLTGWAQVTGGRHVSPADKAALDVWYIRNASLRLDLEIIVRTVPMVFFGERINQDAIQRAWVELTDTGICKGMSFRTDPTAKRATSPPPLVETGPTGDASRRRTTITRAVVSRKR